MIDMEKQLSKVQGPISLLQKYRPSKLDMLRGHPHIVADLRSFVVAPYSRSFIFSGPPGCGKTSAAYAMAGELGCMVDAPEVTQQMSGLYVIASGEQTAGNVRAQITSCSYGTMLGSGWKVIVVNEADFTSQQSSMVWLDVLERLPKKTVVIFTTNEPEKMSDRFRQRSECYSFAAPVRITDEGNPTESEIAAQDLIDHVWETELGHNHSPRLCELENVVNNGQLSYRSVLAALEPLIRIEKTKPTTKKGSTRMKVTPKQKKAGGKKSKANRTSRIASIMPPVTAPKPPKAPVAPVTPKVPAPAPVAAPTANGLQVVKGLFNPKLFGTDNVACFCISMGEKGFTVEEVTKYLATHKLSYPGVSQWTKYGHRNKDADVKLTDTQAAEIRKAIG